MKNTNDCNFELKQLRSFLVVLEEESFTKASRRLRLGQATISNHISGLETALGARLIARSSKGFAITEEGALFKKYCERVFGDLDAVRQRMGVQDTPRALTVAASTVPSQYLLPAALPLLYETFPDLSIHVEVADSREVIESVREGSADIGISGKVVRHRSLAYREICAERIVLASSRRPARAPITPAALRELPFVFREKGSGTRDSYELPLNRLGVHPADLRPVLTCTTTECVKQAVLAGVGVAFLSELSIRDELRRGALHIHPVSKLSIRRAFHFLWLTSHRHGAFLRRVADTLSVAMREAAARQG